jgi:hypothetical protein
MREIRPSGSVGGAGRKPRSYLYLMATTIRSSLLTRMFLLEFFRRFSNMRGS